MTDRPTFWSDWLLDLAFWRPARSAPRSLLVAMLALLLAGGLLGSRLILDGSHFTDGHAIESMDLGMNRAFCGTPSSYSTLIRLPHWIRDHIDQRSVPLRDLLAGQAGSLAAYCASVTVPTVNNENSLMVIESWLLRLRPSASLRDVGAMLQVLRLVVVALFVFALIVCGASLLFGAGVAVAAVAVLGTMPNDVYSAYPFLFVLLILLVAIYALADKYRWTRTSWGLGAVAAIAGAASAVLADMRTSYVPLALAFFSVMVAAELPSFAWRRWPPGTVRPTVIRIAIMIAMFAAGFTAFHHGLITRHLRRDAMHNASHPIGHPLVLSLAVPPNAFSQELGLKWLDEVGRQRALSIDPQAEYMSPRYDATLLNYYRGLWMAYPRRMADLYLIKFSSAGTNALSQLRSQTDWLGRFAFHLTEPYAYVSNGIVLLALYVLLAVGGVVSYLRRRSPAALVLALLSLAAALVQVESGVIYSVFIASYHNYLAFYVLVVSLAAVQFGAVASRAPLTWLIKRTAPMIPAMLVREQRPSWLSCLAIAMVSVVLWVWAMPSWLVLERSPITDQHAARTLDSALARVWCESDRLPLFSAAAGAMADQALRTVPLRTIAERHAGSIAAFCTDAAGQSPEATPLVWVESAVIRMRPQISAAGVGRALHVIRIAGILTAMIGFARAGGGWLSVIGLAGAALWALKLMESLLFSFWPFALIAGLNAAAAIATWRRRG